MEKMEVCILDYGSGNVASVKNALDRLRINNKISNEASDIRNVSHIILPGVGAFGTSMEKIINKIPTEIVKEEIVKGKPFLGICVGMQVFADYGFEFGKHSGLNLLTGTEVVELPASVAKPHVGWNSLEILNEHPILKNIENGSDFYFVHSYHLSKVENRNQVAVTDYGINFPSVVCADNLIGVQFHPEKSQNNGDRLLINFAELT
jgi:glutamine amidotransferase